MKTEEYISSGVLEAYALGELSFAERLEVEQNILLHAEMQRELDRIEEAQEKFLMSAAIQPKGRVKDSLLEKIGPTREGAKVVPMPVRGA